MIKAISLRYFPSSWTWKECIEKAIEYEFEGVEINFDGRIEIDCSYPGMVDNSLLSGDIEIVSYDSEYERAKEIIYEVLIFAKEKGVILSIENVPNKFLLSPLEMKNFIEEIGTEAVGCHFDIANCLYYNRIPEQWIKILKNHIKTVHVKDIRKEIGNYMKAIVNIFDGDINWNNVCRAFAEINYDGLLISEVLPVPQYSPEIFIRSISERIEEIKRMVKERRK